MSILSKPPTIHPIQQIPLPDLETQVLPNGAKLHELNMGAANILKIEWLFDAGRWYEPKALVARATAQLLKSGTPTYPADALADFFDFYGAKLKITDDFDFVSIRLYCLSKYLDKLLPVVQEMLLHPIYDEQELKQFCQRNKQSLRLQMQKNEVLAYRNFTELLFGETHPYGYNSQPEFYENLSREDLLAFHQQFFVANACQVIVSGRISSGGRQQLFDMLEALPQGTKEALLPVHASFNDLQYPLKNHYPSNKSSTQASIRIGSRMFAKGHEDYPTFYFTNTLLGGYFGARLMQNLREDKGYTYSIYSSIETMRHGGYFYIYTDVNTSVKEAALTEIYREMERLQTELVSEEELEMVKNYSLGMFLNAVDGVFNASAVWKELLIEDLDAQFFNQLVSSTHEINPQQIQQIARSYFQEAQLCEVVVG